MTERVSWRQALAWRMRRHRLVHRAAVDELVDVAGAVCGLHAQLMSSAELSLLARVDGLGRDAVPGALWERKELVKLWAARGTLYLLPAAGLGTWVAALGSQTKFGNVGNPEIDVLADAVGRALDGRQLTRDELATEVVRITGNAEHGGWIRSSWGSYLKAASFRGLVCFAPGDGNQVRFTGPASWLGGLDRPARDDAVAEVIRRFLAAYAPATPADLTRWWFGPETPTKGARMLSALGDEVTELDVGGRRAWALTRDVPALTSAEPVDTARLLPAFDPWVVGAARHAPLLPDEHVERVFRLQGWLSPVVLVNGRVAGVWKHTRRRGQLTVELAPFGRLARWTRRQLSAEAERLAGFLGCRLGTVQVLE